ncbi:hypothetical protein [Streptomyces sp. NPDC006510]|uniref:hypothetical protein n=1 Tax=Streptomyces sp. NPDC006510 TaxID=3155600 RepID=UPI0033A8B6DE
MRLKVISMQVPAVVRSWPEEEFGRVDGAVQGFLEALAIAAVSQPSAWEARRP